MNNLFSTSLNSYIKLAPRPDLYRHLSQKARPHLRHVGIPMEQAKDKGHIQNRNIH